MIGKKKKIISFLCVSPLPEGPGVSIAEYLVWLFSVPVILTTPHEIWVLHQLSDRALQFSALCLRLAQAVEKILEAVILNLSSISVYVLFCFLKYCLCRIFITNWTDQVGGKYR